MFDKIIFSGNDQMSMAVAIVNSGYGKMNAYEQADNDLFDFYSVQRVRDRLLFQMFMLAEEVIFTDLPDCYDFTDLCNNTNFMYKTVSNKSESLYYNNNLGLDDSFINYIRPLVITFLVNTTAIPKSNKVNFWEICFRYFYPTKQTLDKDIESKFMDLVDNNYKLLHDSYNLSKFEEKDIFNGFLSYVRDEVRECVENIVWLLELSANNECPIMQDDYDFSLVKEYQPYLSNDTPYAYTLLRIRCEELIGPLPKFESFTDVVRIKNRNRTELRRLRDVLSEFEYVLRTDGKEKAMVKITKDIHLAAHELAKKESNLIKTAKWIQFLAVPIGIAETLLNSPMPYIGVSIEAIGQLTQLGINHKPKKNEWLKLVR